MKRTGRAAGWTLKELMVSIGLLLVVAAMLFPMFGQVDKQAQQVKCTANLKQLASIHLSYLSDHNGSFVPYTMQHGSGNGGTANNSWPEVFVNLGYLSSDGKVFVCPALPGTTNTNLVKLASQNGLRYTYVHYGYNFQHIGGSQRYGKEDGREYIPAKFTQLERPSRTLLLVDTYQKGGGARPDVGRYIVRDNRSGTDYLPHARHSSGLNAAFADGHVEYIRVAEMDNPWEELGETTGDGSLWKRTH